MNKNTSAGLRSPAKTRGAAMHALRRNQDDANRITEKYSKPKPNHAKQMSDKDGVKVTFLGGLEDVGEKNMAIIEYKDEALILDCGNNLGVELPGINYEINDPSYLESIRHKIKAYVITHGHLDHIGGLRHIVPNFTAPIYSSRYSIGIIEKTFDDESNSENFKPDLVVVDIDKHEKIKIGEFFVEFIRVTHAIPDPAAICIDTPVGRIIATGDFRLDPEPLDKHPVDKDRLKQLGDEGVLLLMSDSSYAEAPGRTPTEHTLQASFTDIITESEGRIFVAVFSSNINRTQMIVNAAVKAGRKVALDGRSMLAYAEIAVRQGILKVPKGTIVSMRQAANIPASQLLVMCTGGQGEPNAALQRMSLGEHKYVNLNEGDTVIVSSSPIPGNEVSYDHISNRLKQKKVHLYRHPTHEVDGCGPLHVSGHAKRDELREMVALTRPKYFIPVHAGTLRRSYHCELAIEEGVPRKNTFLPDNGDTFYFTANSVKAGEKAAHGSLLIDQNGQAVSGLVVRDRLLLGGEGIVTVVLTVDKKTGKSLCSPDIITRGFVNIKENPQLMKALRAELVRATSQRFKRVDIDRFKSELRDHITLFIYEQTGQSPMVIPVVNIVDGKATSKTVHSDRPKNKMHSADQKRFDEMRAQLLTRDQID